jgi:hypothetical protein
MLLDIENCVTRTVPSVEMTCDIKGAFWKAEDCQVNENKITILFGLSMYLLRLLCTYSIVIQSLTAICVGFYNLLTVDLVKEQ